MSASIALAAGRISSSRCVTPSAAISGQRVGLGRVAGGEARHGEGQDVGARPPEPVERLRGDDQRLGGIEAARDADHRALDPGGPQPLRQAGDLDVVSLVAVLREPGGIGRHEGESLDRALEADVVGPADRRGTRRAASRPAPAPAVVVERRPSASAPAAAGRGRCRRRRSARRPGSDRSRRASRRSRRSSAWPSQATSVVDSPTPAAA